MHCVIIPQKKELVLKCSLCGNNTNAVKHMK